MSRIGQFRSPPSGVRALAQLREAIGPDTNLTYAARAAEARIVHGSLPGEAGQHAQYVRHEKRCEARAKQVVSERKAAAASARKHKKPTRSHNELIRDILEAS